MMTMVLPLTEAAGEDVNPLLPHTAEIIFAFVFLVLLAIAFAKVVVPKFEKAYADRTAAKIRPTPTPGPIAARP